MWSPDLFKFFARLEAQLKSLTDTLRQANAIESERHTQLEKMLQMQADRLHCLAEPLARASLTPSDLSALSPHFERNLLPSDDAATQKNLVATWQLLGKSVLTHVDLVQSGFRTFSQNDEDGILLRLFSHIGQTNRYVIEIGSNCNGSVVGIPENLSSNLIVNHGWHGAILEMDPVECQRMRYFFARDHATRHFHWNHDGVNTYFSPLVIQQMITPENIDEVLLKANTEAEPDLMIIDIDGGDYRVVDSMKAIRPRVMVVEFEKRFRDRHCVIQRDRADFSQRWAQSGTASLPAWEKLLGERGYTLCSISSTGFNAFFVRSDVAQGKFTALTSKQAFDSHPIFSRLSNGFWLAPDESWQSV